jgi:acylphosphatase
MPKDREDRYDRMRVFGRVQMVLFRDSAKRQASSLGLSGYVKNLADGSVEIVAKGEKEGVTKLFEWAKRGPIFARVDKYEIDTISMSKDLSDFTIEY